MPLLPPVTIFRSRLRFSSNFCHGGYIASNCTGTLLLLIKTFDPFLYNNNNLLTSGFQTLSPLRFPYICNLLTLFAPVTMVSNNLYFHKGFRKLALTEYQTIVPGISKYFECVQLFISIFIIISIIVLLAFGLVYQLICVGMLTKIPRYLGSFSDFPKVDAGLRARSCKQCISQHLN